ncbi:entericidin, EcnA/B family [Rhodovulum sulfidophilum]|uniref:Entericidin, EcnA/B family n=1 Tax=Rhodovulum sulfidophilum TaxID=35806 RepID=A0ABS1RQE5_RHOSU|nr:entericidin, EcnA/B family [Rhodovulum sulfidophilum]MBL3572575.1 entericidin, EcnA/B family [Rhodovulum sulfidophilum]MBL3594051.1 entericidin, EcnA/B family [Rhodovulum sulfidophilum]MBL3608128.1 entericidin, EcnA/B family [Rhodovulum sulfidophilum]MCE8419240.1 entericidin, EcnA/B family [Rhodovulum sulfidophilum]MCE8431628.1 entericidin, EcnA/B family [Rhodovulum sulfidophilum]
MTRLLFILLALALASCSTVEGVGKDISAGARTVRNAL